MNSLCCELNKKRGKNPESKGKQRNKSEEGSDKEENYCMRNNNTRLKQRHKVAAECSSGLSGPTPGGSDLTSQRREVHSPGL